MKNKYLIALAVVLFLWGGFLFFRIYRDKTDVSKHHRAEFERLIRVSKSSRYAGLTDMGRALNRFYKKNSYYPPKLIDLYPEFIPVKAFIEDIDWEYEQAGDNFSLRKSVQRRGSTQTAYIDRRLIPSGKSAALTAAVPKRGRAKPIASTTQTAGAGVQKPPPENKVRRPVVKSDPETPTARTPAATNRTEAPNAEPDRTPSPADNLMANLGFNLAKPTAPRRPIDKETRILSVADGEIGSGISRRTGELFLVWKDENGKLGFGNVDYPARTRISIYKSGRWYAIQRPGPGSIAPLPVGDNRR